MDPSSLSASTMSQDALAALPSITKDNTYGATFVGFAVSATLFGILCAQTYTYLRRYPLDKIWYKALVFTLWYVRLSRCCEMK
ncbi:hypothetical protein BDY19DRAFT_229550 [Irpex rosettiformis]|uniref:Uncharacterized protein n=1 Tax=Irpex rosettiformis TaxID=378272 RepID=A0ACB8U0Y2_9APHY|nr:hypothetical protein BDY19DRAFT_229550 [Irpex rosettiformis]